MPKTKTEELSLTSLFQNESVAQKLFSILPAKELMSLNQVDKALHAATNREDVWKFHWRKLVGATASPEPASFKKACQEINKKLYQERVEKERAEQERVKQEQANQERANMGEFLGSLPDETLISMLLFLDETELNTVSRTSKYLKRLSEDNALWAALIKKTFNIEPPKDKPMKGCFQSIMEVYFQFLRSAFLEKKFIEKYPGVVLTAPKEKNNSKKPLLSFGEDYLAWLCFAGNKAELEKFLSNYSHASISDARKAEDKRVQKLIRLINLALHNENCPEAFSLLMNRLGFENRAALISLLARNKAYYYIFLNFIKSGIPLELVRDEPIHVQIIKNPEKSDPFLIQFTKFLVTYDINFIHQMKDGKTAFYFACEQSNWELVQYFVFEVSQVTLSFLPVGQDSGVSYILRGLRASQGDREKHDSLTSRMYQLINASANLPVGQVSESLPILQDIRDSRGNKNLFISLMRIMSRLIHLFPKLLEEKDAFQLYSERNIAEGILATCNVQFDVPHAEWAEHKELFLSIDNFLLKLKQLTLLHYILINIPGATHPLLDFWIKERGQSVIENKKYVDIPYGNRAPLVLAYLAIKDHLVAKESSTTLSLFKLLFEAGANPNVFLEREPLLYVLIKHDLIQSAKLFLENDADPTYVDDFGVSIIWKESKKHPRLHELVKKNYAKLGKEPPVTKAEQALKIQLLLQQNKKLMADAAKPKGKMVNKSTQTTEEDFQLPSAQM